MTSAHATAIRNSSDSTVSLVDCLKSQTEEENDDLYEIFSRVNFAFTTAVHKKDFSGNDDPLTTRLTLSVPKVNVTQLITEYKSSENQAPVYWKDSAVKNIVKLQTNYLYAEATTGSAIKETIGWKDSGGSRVLQDNTRTQKVFLSSTTGQGDPHITTIKGVNYLLPHVESVLVMYDNDELLINTEMRRFPAYATERCPVLRQSSS